MENLRNSVKAKESILLLANKVHEQSWREHKKLVEYKPANIDAIFTAFQFNYDYMTDNGMLEGTTDLDRFKVVSSYAKAVLTHPLFFADKEKTSKVLDNGAIPMRVCIPNEYFIVMMIRSLMHDLCAAVKKSMWGIDEYHFYLPSQMHNLKYQGCQYVNSVQGFGQVFPKLLHRYSTPDKLDRFPLFAFSFLLRLLEIANDCANFGRKVDYYPAVAF